MDMRQRKIRVFASVAAAGIVAASLAACSSGSDNSSSGGSGGNFAYLGQTENTTIAKTLGTLGKGACADAQKANPLSKQTQPQASYDQQLQLLAGQGALPNMLMSANTPSLVKELIKNKKITGLDSELKAAGAEDNILPAARSTIEALYGKDDLYALPTEFNIEGIWYNKKVFADNNIQVPTTWSQLVAAVGTLKKAGVTPMAAAGKDGWPVTRLVGDYLFRSLGPDALQKVADGDAKLTDDDYVKGAQAVADLGKAGAFGDAVGSVDYNAAENEFLSGKAAMYYMGSWILGDFNDPSKDTIGADNIGFMPFPAVEGGAGSIDQVPANVGVPVVYGADKFASSKKWFDCIVKNYGDTVLKDDGVISGFKIANPPANLPALTAATQATMASAKQSVLWFEALFSAQGTTVSQTNAGALASGSLNAKDFMQKVQDANQS
jgi:raffinose/stachyose/melibiose transport system substrate-binding protein